MASKSDIKLIQETCFARIDNTWNTYHRRTKEMNEDIKVMLSQGNPYIECLIAMQRCWEFSKAKAGQTLCHQFLQVIQELREKTDESVSDEHLTDDIKRKALQVIVGQANQSLIELTYKTYCIDRSNAGVFRSVISDLISNKHIVEATGVVIHLNLKEDFVDELAVPLLLLDKIPLLEKFLDGLPADQERVIRSFDDIYDDPNKVMAAVRRYDIVTVKKADRGLWKKMGRIITKLLKKYKLKPELCPRLQMSQLRSSMRYLLAKKNNEKNVAESWREMVLDQVSDHHVLQTELIRDLVHNSDLKSAHFFAFKLNFPKNEWPQKLVVYVENQPPGVEFNFDVVREDNNNSQTNYLALELSEKQIKLIHTKEEFEEASEVLGKSDLVGMDAEWKPAMGLLQKTRLSLLQIATMDIVYLLDVLELSQAISNKEWEVFFKNLLSHSEKVTLGFGIGEDVRKFEQLAGVPLFATSIRDLNRVQEALSLTRPELLEPVCCPKLLAKQSGLSRLTCRLLGAPLDKAEQCSDWENRPLRQSQQKYAALDAHCLIRCWNVLAGRCRKEENIKDVVRDALWEERHQSEGLMNDTRHSRGSKRGGRFRGRGGPTPRTSTGYHHDEFPILASLGVGYTERAAAAGQRATTSGTHWNRGRNGHQGDWRSMRQNDFNNGRQDSRYGHQENSYNRGQQPQYDQPKDRSGQYRCKPGHHEHQHQARRSTRHIQQPKSYSSSPQQSPPSPPTGKPRRFVERSSSEDSWPID